MTIHESQLMAATVLHKAKRALKDRYARFDKLWIDRFKSKSLAQITIHVDEEPSEDFFAISFKASADMMDEIDKLVEAELNRLDTEMIAMGVEIDTDGD